MPDRDHQQRRALAEAELRTKGVLPSGFPAGMHLLMWLFPRVRPPHYGDAAFWACAMAVLFGLPFAVLLGFLFAADPDLPALIGVLIGCGAGAAFAGLMVPVFRNQHRQKGLTRWEDFAVRAPEPDPAADRSIAATSATLHEQFARTARAAVTRRED